MPPFRDFSQLTLTRASFNPIDPKNSTPSFLAKVARLAAASAVAVLSAVKREAVSKAPALAEAAVDAGAGDMVAGSQLMLRLIL